jgi:hypothetical protein
MSLIPLQHLTQISMPPAGLFFYFLFLFLYFIRTCFCVLTVLHFAFCLLLTTHNTNIHAPGGIQTRNPSKRLPGSAGSILGSSTTTPPPSNLSRQNTRQFQWQLPLHSAAKMPFLFATVWTRSRSLSSIHCPAKECVATPPFPPTCLW